MVVDVSERLARANVNEKAEWVDVGEMTVRLTSVKGLCGLESATGSGKLMSVKGLPWLATVEWMCGLMSVQWLGELISAKGLGRTRMKRLGWAAAGEGSGWSDAEAYRRLSARLPVKALGKAVSLSGLGD